MFEIDPQDRLLHFIAHKRSVGGILLVVAIAIFGAGTFYLFSQEAIEFKALPLRETAAPSAEGQLEDADAARNRGDYAGALKLLRPLAVHGNAPAQYNLGVLYAKGQAVPQDGAEAAKWFSAAADQGHANAQYNLGIMYAEGQGVPQSYTDAIKWFRLAAEQGHVRAQHNLGVQYLSGQGVPQSDAETVKWFRLAADKGNADSQYDLGFLYQTGQAVLQNYAEAMKWYRLAADQGHASAQYNLGFMFTKGQGVSQDYVQAYVWFTLSAADGRQDASQNRDIIARRMTPMQIDEAQKRVREWKDHADQNTGDLAVALVAEFNGWFQNLAAKGIIPRAFTGVTKEGKQGIVILTGLPLDHVQRRNFLIWLCRTEKFIAYAYGTEVVVAETLATTSRGIDIYASSDRYDATKTLSIEKQPDGSYRFHDQFYKVLPTKSTEDFLFFRLQRSTDRTSRSEQEMFSRLWTDLKPKVMWRQR